MKISGATSSPYLRSERVPLGMILFLKEGGKFIVVAGGDDADGSLHFIQLEEKSDDNATGDNWQQ